MRDVVGGETLSGHGAGGDYPELLIYDGLGAGSGSMMFVIGGFHNCTVTIRDDATTLVFEGRLPVTIHGGIVQYSDPSTWDEETKAMARKTTDLLSELSG
jgi:hypothetical protein